MPPPLAPAPRPVVVARAADRAVTRLPGIESRHSFSFGRFYDPANTHHGDLVANNHDSLAAGAGFDRHPHASLEIVTWVLRGALVHDDSEGNSKVVSPGLVQRMSAGRGIHHSERNARTSGDERASVAYVQMWVRPDDPGSDPSYQQAQVDEAALAAGLVPIASGRPRQPAVIALGNRGCTLYAARLPAGGVMGVPEAAFVHVYLATGAAAFEDVGDLGAGDAVRLTSSGGHRLTATKPTELLIWEMQTGH